MRTSYGIGDWFFGRKTIFKAEGLGKLAMFSRSQDALAVEADETSVFLRTFHTDCEWAILEPEEARRLAENLVKAADAVDAAQAKRPE